MPPQAALQQEVSSKLQKQLRRLAGKWVATAGDEIIAHGEDAKKVYQEAKRQGVDNPAIFKVPDKGRRTYFF